MHSKHLLTMGIYISFK